MKIPQRILTNGEELIMKVVWDSTSAIENNGEVTCGEIQQILREQYNVDYKETTIYTFLTHLKEKGFISADKKGVYFYRPVISETDYLRIEFSRLNKLWFHGDKAKLEWFIAENDLG